MNLKNTTTTKNCEVKRDRSDFHYTKKPKELKLKKEKRKKKKEV